MDAGKDIGGVLQQKLKERPKKKTESTKTNRE
jgi:hypothetical protein